MSEKVKEGIDCNDSEVKKALESTDISVIERARDMEIGRVTKYVDQIHAILKIDDKNASYSHESVSKIKLCEVEAGLREAFGKVDDLNEWLTSQLLSKAEEANGVYSYAEEDRIIEEQSDFIMPVWKKYHEGIVSIERYNRACEIGQKEVTMIKDKESFENAKNVGQATADSDDADVIRTGSEVVKEELEELIVQNQFERSQSSPNLINKNYSNEIKTEFVKPEKSQCPDGSMVMSLKDRRESERFSADFQCENGLDVKGFESDSDDELLKADKAVPLRLVEEGSTEANDQHDAAVFVGGKPHKFEANLVKLEKNPRVDNQERHKKKDVAAINEKASENNVENQFIKLSKIINLQLQSRNVGPIKLTTRWVSLEKLIGLVVYTAGHISGHSVNMMRWAGRASMVIVNQEEKDMNIDTSKNNQNDKGVNCAVLDAALGDTKMYKSLLKAAMNNLLWETILKLFTTLIEQKWQFVSVTFVSSMMARVLLLSWIKECDITWSIKIRRGVEEN